MSKLTIFLSIVIVYFCCIAIGYGDSTSGPSSNSGVVAPKKVRVLSPSASRLYRLLRNGLNQVGDEDLFTEEDMFLQNQKRQYDDYGHMRFGKRTGSDFDDYGHLRFGK